MYYRKYSVSQWVLISVFILITIATIGPFFLILSTSLTPEELLNSDGFKLIPKTFTLDAYKYVMTDWKSVAGGYGISILTTVTATVLSVLIIALYAYPLSRKEFKYKGIFTFIVFFTMLFNGGIAPKYIVFVSLLGLKDNLWATIIPHLIPGFFVIVMRTYFITSVPDSIVESARMDGAGNFRVLFQLVFPISLPGLATIGLFSTLGMWNDWFNFLVFIAKPERINLQLLMYQIQLAIDYLKANPELAELETFILPEQSARMAMCIIGIGPIIMAYPYFQKYFIKGLTVGSIKG